MAVQQRVGMPMDEFIREFDAAPFELIDGERIVRMPPVYGHGLVWDRLFFPLRVYGHAHPEIVEIFAEIPFVLTYNSDWVTGSRVPDIMVYRTERIAAYRGQTPNYEDMPIILVPDLVIEIVSANDNYLELDAKVDAYLADGVKLVWVVNPRSKTVKVYAQGSYQIELLTLSATLIGGDILPDFALPLKDIFPA
jgi:Uma2 family endonuclease